MENICMCCGLLFCWGLPSQAYAGSAPGEPRPRNSNEGGSRRSAAPWRLLRSVKFGRPSPPLCSGCLRARAAGEWRREAAALLENTPLVVGQARRRDAHWHPGESRRQGASPRLSPPRAVPDIDSPSLSFEFIAFQSPPTGRASSSGPVCHSPGSRVGLACVQEPSIHSQTARAPYFGRVTALPFPACKIPGGG